MISDPHATCAVSSLGWVDHDHIWVLRAGAPEPVLIPLGSHAAYASVHAGTGGWFSVAHHFKTGTDFRITVHSFADPGTAAGVLDLVDGRGELTGDAECWAHVPRFYPEWISARRVRDFHLVRLDAASRNAVALPLPWFNDDYDKGYQGVTGALELPGTDQVLVSVQRSSELVLCEATSGARIRLVPLCDRGGSGDLLFSRDGRTLWAVDYDTLARLDPHTLEVRASRHLQVTLGVREFIGGISLDPGGLGCLVARPFKSDVVLVDPESLATVATAPTGGQPLQAVLLSGGGVVAREWKTGVLLRSTLQS